MPTPASGSPPALDPPVIRRVLVATDFSDCGNEALRHAIGMVRPGGEIRVLHVCYVPTAAFDLGVVAEAYNDPAIATAQAHEEAAAKLAELQARVPATPDVILTTEITDHHDIAAGICEAAERFGAGVISMGSKGHSRAHVALLGSTVQGVLARSHRPVFIVTPQRK